LYIAVWVFESNSTHGHQCCLLEISCHHKPLHASVPRPVLRLFCSRTRLGIGLASRLGCSRVGLLCRTVSL